jgi:hypothetical protein
MPDEHSRVEGDQDDEGDEAHEEEVEPHLLRRQEQAKLCH